MFEPNPVGELLARLLTLPPDTSVINALLTIDRTALSDVDAVTFLQLHQKVAAWWASVQAEVMLVAASTEPLRREGIVLAMDSEEERTVWIEECAARSSRWRCGCRPGRRRTSSTPPGSSPVPSPPPRQRSAWDRSPTGTWLRSCGRRTGCRDAGSAPPPRPRSSLRPVRSWSAGCCPPPGAPRWRRQWPPRTGRSW